MEKSVTVLVVSHDAGQLSNVDASACTGKTWQVQSRTSLQALLSLRSVSPAVLSRLGVVGRGLGVGVWRQ